MPQGQIQSEQKNEPTPSRGKSVVRKLKKYFKYFRLTALLFILLILLSPLWCPWALQPVLSMANIQLSNWSYSGGWSYVKLEDVQLKMDSFRIQVDKLTFQQPLFWLARWMNEPSSRTSFVKIEGWELHIQPIEDTAPFSLPFYAPGPALEWLEKQKGLISKLHPRLELSDGFVKFDTQDYSIELNIPIIRGDLDQVLLQAEHDPSRTWLQAQLRWTPPNLQEPAGPIQVNFWMHNAFGEESGVEPVAVRGAIDLQEEDDKSSKLTISGSFSDLNWTGIVAWNSESWIPEQGSFNIAEQSLHLPDVIFLLLEDFSAPRNDWLVDLGVRYENQNFYWDLSTEAIQADSQPGKGFMLPSLSAQTKGRINSKIIQLDSFSTSGTGFKTDCRNINVHWDFPDWNNWSSWKIEASEPVLIQISAPEIIQTASELAALVQPFLESELRIPDDLKDLSGVINIETILPDQVGILNGSTISVSVENFNWNDKTLPGLNANLAAISENEIQLNAEMIYESPEPKTMASLKAVFDPVNVSLDEFQVVSEFDPDSLKQWVPQGIQWDKISMNLELKEALQVTSIFSNPKNPLPVRGNLFFSQIKLPQLLPLQELSLKFKSPELPEVIERSTDSEDILNVHWDLLLKHETGSLISGGAVRLASDLGGLNLGIQKLNWAPVDFSGDSTNLHLPALKLNEPASWQAQLNPLNVSGSLKITELKDPNAPAKDETFQMGIDIPKFAWPESGTAQLQIDHLKPVWALGWMDPLPGIAEKEIADKIQTTKLATLKWNAEWENSPVQQDLSVEVQSSIPALSQQQNTAISQVFSEDWKVQLKVEGNAEGIYLKSLALLNADKNHFQANGSIPFILSGGSEGFSLQNNPDNAPAFQFSLKPIYLKEFQPVLPEIIKPVGYIVGEGNWNSNEGWKGALEFQGLTTNPVGLAQGVDQFQGRIDLKANEIWLSNLQGQIGDQSIGINGWINTQVTLDHLLSLQEFKSIEWKEIPLPTWNIQVKGEELTVVQRPGMALRTSLDITTERKPKETAIIEGKVSLDPSIFITDIQALVVQGPKQSMPKPPFFKLPIPIIEDWRLNLQISGNEFLRIRSPVFHGSSSVAMNLKGKLGDPILIGDVMLNSGSLLFPFGKLKIKQGIVSISENNPSQLVVYIIAGSRVYGYQIQMEVSGTAEAPVAIFSSNPPLSSQQILLLLTAGKFPQNELSYSSAKKASALAMYSGKSLLDRWALEEPGDSRLSIESGESVSNNGRVTYNLEYLLTEKWSLTGEYDEYDAINAGVKYQLINR